MRIVRAAVVAALAGGVVGGAQLLERPPAGSAPTISSGYAAATQAGLVCPGDPFVGISGVEDVKTESVALARSPKRSVVEAILPEAPPQEGELTLSGVGAGETVRATDGAARRKGSYPDGARVDATGAAAPGLVAAQTSTADTDDAHGTSTAPCLPDAAEHWLVAGAGAAGRQERLVLVNPGDNPVTVDLTVVRPASGDEDEDEDGPEQPAAGQGVVVPAGGREALLLDAVTSTSSSEQVVHVVATGGTVGAWVADRWLDGLKPSGLEVVPPTAGPERSVVLSGVPEGERSRLVIAAPGHRDAIVTVREVGSESASSIGVETVPAGRSRSISLPDSDGARSLVITSDEPVVAAAEVLSARSGDRRDLSWTVATPATSDLVGVALPGEGGLDRELMLTGGESATTVETIAVTGTTERKRTVDVPADRTVGVSLDDADAVWARVVSGDTPVHAGVVARSGGDKESGVALASTPLLRARTTERSVDVIPLP